MPFSTRTLSGEPQADLSCIYAGASSGGAEDPYVCCDFGGEDGGNGAEEEEEVMVLRSRRKFFGTVPPLYERLAGSCGHQPNVGSPKLCISRPIRSVQRRRWCPRRRMHCLISFSHHAYMYQANQDKESRSDTLTLVFILVRCDCISTSILYDHTQRCLNSPAFF